MSVQLELWHLILMLLAFFGCVAAFGKLLLDRIDKQLDERFAALDKAREEGQSALRETFTKHIEEERREIEALRNIERDFLTFKADLPIHYVRREDYVRGQTVIEAKLDALYNKLEVVQMKGAGHG